MIRWKQCIPVYGWMCLCGLLSSASPVWAGLSCHIHPPAGQAKNAESPMIIGPFSSTIACEQANTLLYGGQGRCHCSFDNSGKGSLSNSDLPPGEAPGATPLP